MPQRVRCPSAGPNCPVQRDAPLGCRRKGGAAEAWMAAVTEPVAWLSCGQAPAAVESAPRTTMEAEQPIRFRYHANHNRICCGSA